MFDLLSVLTELAFLRQYRSSILLGDGDLVRVPVVIPTSIFDEATTVSVIAEGAPILKVIDRRIEVLESIADAELTNE